MTTTTPAPTTTTAAERPAGRSARLGAGRRLFGVALLAAALVLVGVGSLAVGAKPISTSIVLDAIFANDSSVTDHLIVRELRLPRTIVGLAVGAALGVAGALMQGLTRNPLADPGLLGVTAGASFAVVLAIWAFSFGSLLNLVWFAFVGAAIASVLVYALGSVGRGGATPVRLALAGAAMNALLFALTRAVTLLDQATLDQFRFWAVGSLSGRDQEVAATMTPFIVVGLILAVVVSRRLNALALGEDMARALGTKIGSTRALTGLAVTLLTGAAVAAAGPVAFIGLVVPHAVRAWFGPDQRWLIPASALAGPTMLLFCDIIGRVIARPGEVQVGIMTAAIGGPAFVVLVRRSRMAQL
ncbi:MAG: iron chelate uptake ABC transporter family permease subunit [Actinomycetota bacterium]